MTIQQLMNIREHSDLTASELENFRGNFGGHAYPCRFPSCTYAIKGFGDNEERVAHEIEHTPRFPCVEPGCQYPPFGSSRALRRHQLDCHGKRRRELRVKVALSNMRERRGMDSQLIRSGTHEVKRVKAFRCGIQGCNQEEGFNTGDELESHVMLVHGEPQGVGGMSAAVQEATQQPESPLFWSPPFPPDTENRQWYDPEPIFFDGRLNGSSLVSPLHAPHQPSNNPNAPALQHLDPEQQQLLNHQQQSMKQEQLQPCAYSLGTFIIMLLHLLTVILSSRWLLSAVPSGSETSPRHRGSASLAGKDGAGNGAGNGDPEGTYRRSNAIGSTEAATAEAAEAAGATTAAAMEIMIKPS